VLFLSSCLEDLIKNDASKVGVFLDRKMVQAFLIYLKELKEWNQKINLTSLKKDEAIITNHFIDSLSITPHLPSSASILDLGSGAGFPGIPLKIAAPAHNITLLESTRKKANFLRHIIRRLGLSRTTVVECRAEHFKSSAHSHPGFDCVIARALAPLKIFLQLGAPLVIEGGQIVAMKGEKAEEELKECQAALKDFSLEVDKKIALQLPPSNKKRHLIFIKKV
jgi:16S rRNA (guanine527-N7)-methyltransferase